jgi:uncharacterized circularly permuted ATP-grasp superfamily protein
MGLHWSDYPAQGPYDELVLPSGRARPGAEVLCAYLASLDEAALAERVRTAEQVIRLMGITFRVYGQDGGSIDRHWPYDLIPRVLPLSEWRRIEEGLRQRALVLNLFIDDVYHDQRAFTDGVVPHEILATSRNFRPECVGASPPHGVWAHVCGSDWCATGTAPCTCWRTTCACPRASPTCSRTARSPSGASRNCSARRASCRWTTTLSSSTPCWRA